LALRIEVLGVFAMKNVFCVSLFAMLFAGSALAGGFSVREQSAEGLGSAFAGIAAGTDGLSAMFWNPATISEHSSQGYVSESNVSGILPYSQSGEGKGFPNDSGNIGLPALVPASYYSYGLTEEVTIGLAMNAPFGLTTDSDLWKGSYHGNHSAITSINLNPMIAYKPVDWITLAAGVQGEYLRAKLSSTTPTGATLFYTKADDIAFGFTAGVLLQPTEDLDIGIGYRSSISHSLEGNGSYVPAGYINKPMTAAFDTPELVTVGVKFQANEQLKLMAGAEWANWSRFKSLDIKSASGATLVSTPEKWKDSWFFSGGAEYVLNDKMTLRGGAAYEVSPVPDATRTPRLPDNDRIWLSAGASYKMNNWLTTNIGYSHVFVKDGGVLLTSPTPLSANFKQHIDILSLSAVVDW
jgi:long-chain fatty acid transport protein